jgi:hypothetical protein
MTRIAITVLALIHLFATLWHGNAHTKLAIELPPAKTIFVVIVILIAPLISVGFVWTRYLSAGLWIFFLSMLGALLFGVYHHYVMVSPDNVGHLPAGNPEFHSQFISSAAIIAVLELVSALVGAYFLYSHRARVSAS